MTGIGVLVVAVAFAVFCLADLARAGQVRYLPKWAWALLICATSPWGGLAYLIAGRARTPPGPTSRSRLRRQASG